MCARKKKKTNCFSIMSFPWFVILLTILVDQKVLQKKLLSYFKILLWTCINDSWWHIESQLKWADLTCVLGNDRKSLFVMLRGDYVHWCSCTWIFNTDWCDIDFMLPVLSRKKKITLHGCFNNYCGREFCHLELPTPIVNSLLLRDEYYEIQLYNQPSETKLIIGMHIMYYCLFIRIVVTCFRRCVVTLQLIVICI